MGWGGDPRYAKSTKDISQMTPVDDRLITVRFNANKASNIAWKFAPKQESIKIRPGETALAFFSATNPTDKTVCGISTYNVTPGSAGFYFNKIQCFCFEEQFLNPHEQVDLPVFFYIDPDYVKNPSLLNVNEIMLSYTFYEAKESFNLPLPDFLTQDPPKH
ncbi:cytochrome c oxidase assembly protein COX11, mitochondrial-like [Octopus sinensis]|uniref:Cytochrome c oxidase assembly protein COX11, mitochondrial n=1 Tax=Octopus sinensis TaxID=2607531 RepID=A0A7E6EMI8_9MOLL|nr:cytochrome c oxidase assembly protein COX11, mitochondrial-like [Octopus sinensis]